MNVEVVARQFEGGRGRSYNFNVGVSGRAVQVSSTDDNGYRDARLGPALRYVEQWRRGRREAGNPAGGEAR